MTVLVATFRFDISDAVRPARIFRLSVSEQPARTSQSATWHRESIYLVNVVSPWVGDDLWTDALKLRLAEAAMPHICETFISGDLAPVPDVNEQLLSPYEAEECLAGSNSSDSWPIRFDCG